MVTLSLRSKITGFSIAVLISVAVLAYTGYSAVENMLALTKLETVNAAVRGQMELDMMHDAIKGDVQSASAAVTSRNADEVSAARTSLEEHKQVADEALAKLAALSLSTEVKQSIDEAVPQFKEYAGNAASFIEQAREAAASGNAVSQAAQEEFEKRFEHLEEVLGGAGDKVIDWSKHIKDEGVATAAREQKTLLLVLTLAIGLAIILPIYMYVKVFKPLGRLVFISNALANEEYDVAIRETRRGDEIGKLAKALDTLRSKAAISFQLKNMVDEMPLNIITADAHNGFKISYANKASKQTLAGLQQHINVRADDIEQHSIDIFHKDPKRIRDLLSVPGNLPHHAKITVGPETLDLKVYAMFDRNSNYIGPMLTWEVVTARVKLANDFESSIGTVSSQVDSSATMLQERATSLQGAIEELSVSALEISKRVHDSLEIVRSAVSTGNEASSLTSQLANSADRITSVVTLIRSIAEKTNLLALNATIESARAGDAGKGFAVVANEVKTLASQTANAIVEITTQISEIQAAANNTATAISQMTQIVQKVDAISTTIAGTVEEQQAATNEIARNISGMNDGNISSGIAASTIMGMASQLAEVSSHLQAQCDGFLQKVRAI